MYPTLLGGINILASHVVCYSGGSGTSRQILLYGTYSKTVYACERVRYEYGGNKYGKICIIHEMFLESITSVKSYYY